MPLSTPSRRSLLNVCVLCGFAAALSPGHAQTKAPVQVINPPKTQLWMDVSTGGMAGMPELEIPGMGGLMGGIMGALGGKGKDAGGGKTGTHYYGAARTPHMMPPRILDVALWNSLKPGVDAVQNVPAGLRMGDSLPLMPVQLETTVLQREPGEVPPDMEPPKGRLLMYWGCGNAVRAGQPRILDFSKLSTGNIQAFGTAFSGRFAPDRGAKVKSGYAVFPNERDQKSIPKRGSLVGEHRVSGDGIPASFKFSLGPEQDVMPGIALQSTGSLQDSIALSWGNVDNARAYYLHAMSTQGNDIILWSSSENGDSGMGLFDYLSNATIERWTKERVLLHSSVNQCNIPKGILAGQGKAAGDKDSAAFLRMIAYGGEYNVIYPPRPTDPKVAWDQEWSVRLRLKSHTMAMLGQDMGDMGGNAGRNNAASPKEDEAQPAQAPNPINLLRGLFGK